MTSELRLRPLMSADLPQVRSWMEAAAEAPHWSDSDLAQAASAEAAPTGRERRGWVAADASGQLQGFLVATALHLPGAAAECELEFLFVAFPHRHSGVGRALIGQLFAWAHAVRAESIRLEVRASNAAARRLYGLLGFKETGVRPGYYREPAEDAVLMRRASDALV